MTNIPLCCLSNPSSPSGVSTSPPQSNLERATSLPLHQRMHCAIVFAGGIMRNIMKLLRNITESLRYVTEPLRNHFEVLRNATPSEWCLRNITTFRPNVMHPLLECLCTACINYRKLYRRYCDETTTTICLVPELLTL